MSQKGAIQMSITKYNKYSSKRSGKRLQILYLSGFVDDIKSTEILAKFSRYMYAYHLWSDDDGVALLIPLDDNVRE
jgi:hypothetical protein